MTASAWRRSGLEPPPFERRTSPGPGGAHRARPRVRFYKKVFTGWGRPAGDEMWCDFVQWQRRRRHRGWFFRGACESV